MAMDAGASAAAAIEKASAAAITAQSFTSISNIQNESAVKQSESVATTATNNAKTMAGPLDAAAARS